MPDYTVPIFPSCTQLKQGIVNSKIESFLTSRSQVQVQLRPVSVLRDRITFEELHDMDIGSW